jgi:hypothetical protein
MNQDYGVAIIGGVPPRLVIGVQVELRDAWGKSPAEIGWANIAAQEADGAEISIMTQARMEAREIAIHGRKPKHNGNGNGNAHA